ncbi:MAG: hypothetical protein GX596_10595, partial [Propionibacterium sp.]|nr:hypothetical protein [Propionibacterium sp.]
ATGAFDPFYNANFTVHEVAVFAVRDGLIYATTSSELGHVLLVFGDGQEIVWQVGATLPGLMDCHLLGDYVGCDDPTSFVVLDSATGDPVLSGEKGSGEYITWSDGGVVVAEHFADTYTVQLFAGGEEEHDEVPLNLNTLYPGTSLPLEHLFDEGVEFDSSGRAVVERDFFANLVFASTRERVPDEYKYGLEPSETGVVFLGDELLSDTNELLDNQGQVIASTPEQVHVIDGVLVVRSMDYPNLRVYPPAG